MFLNIRELPGTPTRLRGKRANAIPTRVRRRELTICTSLVPVGGAKARVVCDVLRPPCSNPDSTVGVYLLLSRFFNQTWAYWFKLVDCPTYSKTNGQPSNADGSPFSRRCDTLDT